MELLTCNNVKKSLGFKGDTDQACFRYMYHILTQYANNFKAEHCS